MRSLSLRSTHNSQLRSISSSWSSATWSSFWPLRWHSSPTRQPSRRTQCLTLRGAPTTVHTQELVHFQSWALSHLAFSSTCQSTLRKFSTKDWTCLLMKELRRFLCCNYCIWLSAYSTSSHLLCKHANRRHPTMKRSRSTVMTMESIRAQTRMEMSRSVSSDLSSKRYFYFMQ